jgi:hypothetical protein
VTPVLWVAVFVADSAGVASGAAAAALDVIKTDAVTAAAAARLVKIRRFMTSPIVLVLGSTQEHSPTRFRSSWAPKRPSERSQRASHVLAAQHVGSVNTFDHTN